MIEWLKQRSFPTRVLLYTAAAILAFAVAAGIGAMTALMIQGDLSLPAREGLGSSDEHGNTPQRREADADQSRGEEPDSKQVESASQQTEAEYVSRVGDIQAKSVETLLDSHDKLLRYDALTAEDVKDIQGNQVALQGFTTQVDNLRPPQTYKEQYEVFRFAVNDLHEAAQVAYRLAADPTAATQSGFDQYDRYVNEASAGLRRSNEILGRDYKTIEGVQRVSLLS
jgi:hypothetical protein